jgi:hypothetical protein
MSEWQPSKKQFRDEATCRIRFVMKEVREAISKVLDLKLSPPSSKKANSPMTETGSWWGSSVFEVRGQRRILALSCSNGSSTVLGAVLDQPTRLEPD